MSKPVAGAEDPRWPVVLLILGAALLVASVARATPRGPVYIVPILHQDSQQPDRLLSSAFRQAIALRVPVAADWRWGAPDPTVCERGCRVVRISGRRAPTPHYVLTLRQFPQWRQVAATRFSGPSDTTVDLLADALLLKTSFLLRINLVRTGRSAGPSVRRVVTPRAAPSPRPAPAPARRPSRPRLQLSVAAGSLLGTDADMMAAGLEVAASLRLVGPFTIKGVAGWHINGQVSDAFSRFHAFPVHLLLGADFHWRRFQLGIFAGGTAMLFRVTFDDHAVAAYQNAEMKGVSGGPTVEVRFGLRVHRRLSIGLTNRVTYMVNSLQTELSANGETTRFQVPRVLLQVGLDVTLSF